MKRLAVIIAIILLYLFSFTLPALAVTPSNPSSTPTIDPTKITIHRNLISSGDMLITALYNIPYTTLPTSVDPNWTADKTFIFRLIHTDNVTELGNITPYPYSIFAGGYREGVLSFYFSPTAAPAWGGAYTLRISENPALFTTPLFWDTVIPTTSYTPLTDRIDNQRDLADGIISLARSLATTYSVTLISTSGGVSVLNVPNGETYFRAVIYGLDALAPTVVFKQEILLDYSPTAYLTTQFDTYATTFNGTWVGTAQTATATQFGLAGQLVTSLPILLICFGFILLSSLLVRKMEPGWVISCLILIMGSLLGWVPLALFAIIYQTMAIYLAWIWYGSRSQWLNFLTITFFTSTLICLILEGSYFGTSQNSVINDLTVFNSHSMSNFLSLASAGINFFRGLVRVLLFDYSFYSGAWVILRYFWVLVTVPAVAWELVRSLSSAYASFMPRI